MQYMYNFLHYYCNKAKLFAKIGWKDMGLMQIVKLLNHLRSSIKIMIIIKLTKGKRMYTIKKLSLTFILLNVFMFQSLMADMIFYYNAAILPSIISSQQQADTPPIANFDNVPHGTIETVTVNVLANDIIPEGSTVTVLLEQYAEVYTDNVDVYEGSWHVDGDNVIFAPHADFSGGIVQMWYQITDQNGNTSKSWINIEDPVLIQAVHDEVSPSTIIPVTMDVLANDLISEGSTVTVSLEIYGESSPEHVSFVETFDGNWSVEANQSITFTPNANFGGGDAWINYQIEDQYGHTSRVDIGIRYPVYVYAEYDWVQPSSIGTTIINVLENDTMLDPSTVSILLESYDEYGQPIYVGHVNSYGGTWIVDGPDVVFAPEPYFAGGTVGISYQITDDQGHVSQTWITIEFPIYVQANYDTNQTTTVEGQPVTVDVLKNDIIGPDVTPTVLLEIYGESGAEYVPFVERFDGNWNVEANQSVTFTPNENFAERYTSIGYQLSDENGHVSSAGITIEYPVSIYAEQDYVQTNIIEPITIDILKNDTNTSAVTVLFEVYGMNGREYLPSVESFNGNWIVEANQSVTFTPNTNYGGGSVWMWYQITDQEGRTSTAGISIEYPLFIYAGWDQVVTDTIAPITIDVLANDMNSSAITIEIVNRNYGTGSEEIGTVITTHQGLWTANDADVSFEPNSDFAGGSVYIEYQITDQEGHMSRTSIELVYPIGPTPVCTAASLSTVEAVYTTLTDNLSFVYSNFGQRAFEAELDTKTYTIDPDLYTPSVSVTELDPMYIVRYSDREWLTFSGDTFVEVRLSSTQVKLNTNGTWFYDDSKSGNDRGYKYLASESESGTYLREADGSNTLNIGGDAVFSLKAVREISESEINNIFKNIGIMLTLAPGDTAQLNLIKELETYYDWWGLADGNNYASLNDYIVSKEHNASLTQFYDNGVLWTAIWQKVIIFAGASSGQTSGDLVEIDRQTNEILTDAGTWRIETITDDQGATYDIIITEPTLCGYEKRIFKLDGSGMIIQGQREEAGVVGAELAFSDSLKDKLGDYFISVSPLDIDPANPSNPEITEVMLTSKIFYTVREDLGAQLTYFSRITVSPTNQVEKEDFTVDNSGTVIGSTNETLYYWLENGRIRFQGANGDVLIGLNSDPGNGDWDVTIYTWGSLEQEIWLLNEPGDFPQ